MIWEERDTRKVNKLIIADSKRVGDTIQDVKMEKIISLILLLSLLLGTFCACGKKDNETPSDTDTDNGGSTDTEGEGEGEGEPELPKLDFLTADLSEYVELDEKYYKGYVVDVDPDRVKDIEVSHYIIQLLREKKGKDPVEGDGVVSVGDVVSIFYKGYYLDAEGERVYFDGGSNVGSSSYALEIGSGGFIPGFEYNMIGMVISEYSSENPLTVEAYFPENYGKEELNGKTAYFEVYVALKEDGSYNVTEYDAPVLDESFIFDTLGFTAEELSRFEGEGTVEKFRSLVKDMLINEAGLDVDSLCEAAFWKSVSEGAIIKKYPERELSEIYDQLLAELKNYYESNIYFAYYYPTLDIFIRAYFGLGEGEDWKPSVTEMAKENLKERLIFYYVVRKENLLMTPDEYEAAFTKYLEDALESMDITREKYDTEEEYLAALNYYKEQMEKNGSIDNIKDMLYYEHGMKEIFKFAVINELE